MGKLIVLTGCDSSGKATQLKILEASLKNDGYRVATLSFPQYETSTGKIIAGPCLGKEPYEPSYFEEGFTHVDPKVAILYYAADRRNALPKLRLLLEENDIVIMDRYVESNMAHQGCKIEDKTKREELFAWVETLEYDMLEMPRPTITIFLHLPYQQSLHLIEKRKEKADSAEKDLTYMQASEKSYLHLKDYAHFKVVECFQGTLRTKEDIHQEIYEIVKKVI